ncbi:MAG TPA: efflux RND transporter periplasmic adaptor subunit, partial [Gemmataceae bacterium]|nr:efflux RND transporter periplasmic adaptor subunit [Gemmataceae bacterium]
MKLIGERLLRYARRLLERWNRLPTAVRATTIALALLGTTAGLFWQAQYVQNLSDPERARRAGKPIPVRTELIVEQDIEEVVGATALTAAAEIAPVQLAPSRRLNASGPGSDLLVTQVLVHEGDVVSQGQPLFELDDALLKKTVDECEAALTYAQAKLRRVREQVRCNPRFRELDLEAAREQLSYRRDDDKRRDDEFNRYNRMKSQNTAASDFQVLEAFSALLQARYNHSDARRALERTEKAIPIGELQDQENLAAAVTEVERAEQSLLEARRDWQRARIVSPFNGVVGTQDIVAGTYIAANAILTNVYKLDPIFVRLDFPQERLDAVGLGQRVEIVLDSFPQETFPGKVIRIAPRVDSRLRVLGVVVEVANPQYRIKAGVSGFARVLARRKAVVAPAAAVLQQSNKAMVFRVADGRAQAREIQVGRVTEGELLPVQRGLAAGDEVVVFHNFY